jgi:ELWxxDGT repeat protein
MTAHRCFAKSRWGEFGVLVSCAALLIPVAAPSVAETTSASRVKDIRLGPKGSNPRGLTEVNGTVFFSACRRATGCELWKSDGTRAGTSLVKDGPIPSDIWHLVRTAPSAFGGLTSTSRNLQSKQTINDSWFIQEPS